MIWILVAAYIVLTTLGWVGSCCLWKQEYGQVTYGDALVFAFINLISFGIAVVILFCALGGGRNSKFFSRKLF